jgi:hypothetical protein
MDICNVTILQNWYQQGGWSFMVHNTVPTSEKDVCPKSPNPCIRSDLLELDADAYGL